ncbi:MAG TPA: glycogen debranching N-terminal domain-containing protein [Gemmatimonadaceae bacterium]|nr:glycogen debranching N-terminal domain-containing protein [Gemmatimonadaceae bacterium]
MPHVLVRPGMLYAWKGPSLLITDGRGECGRRQPLSGYYFREARFLRTLRLELDGGPPWLCETAAVEPDALAITYVHPELVTFGGGGSGQAGDETTTDAHGIPHRALDVRARFTARLADLHVSVAITNRSRRDVELELAWVVDTDFADIQEAQAQAREWDASIDITQDGRDLRFRCTHPQLPYATHVCADPGRQWEVSPNRLSTPVRLAPQEDAIVTLRVLPIDFERALAADDVDRREQCHADWREQMARVSAPRNLLAEEIIARNVRDMASFAMLEGEPDEWLTLQAGVPLYPALFGRDTLTAGWQAAFLDRGASLDASLARLGRLQSSRVYEWRDEEPGRIPYQVRQGPLARLDINPYSAYYADYASPLMYVISLAHLYAWTGDRECLRRHWDTARRILDWAREYGDKDGDGYLEYHTRSSKGTKNQGWKDSGDAIVYHDGSPVPPPIATCELQGYWFAAQQLAAVLSWAMGERDSARALWRAAAELRSRFNRDWWVDSESFFALALDPDKRQVPAVTSNVGHCIACGIIDDEHLPRVVGRTFAPDVFSGWGIRTLSTRHASYNPLSYHLGSVWAVENATIVFGLRRFGFDARALELARAQFDLAQLYPDYRIPECVGGYARSESSAPGAYPRANTPQLWNASVFPLLVHAMLGLQPVAPLDLLVIDPVLPTWLPEMTITGLRLGGAMATIRFWRDEDGSSHGEVLHKRGTLHLVKQPPLESLSAGLRDRFSALADSVLHH